MKYNDFEPGIQNRGLYGLRLVIKVSGFLLLVYKGRR